MSAGPVVPVAPPRARPRERAVQVEPLAPEVKAPVVSREGAAAQVGALVVLRGAVRAGTLAMAVEAEPAALAGTRVGGRAWAAPCPRTRA